jgi:hypothetical protein
MIADANPGLVAVMGLTTVELVKLWQSVAPSLEDVRAAPADDVAIATRLQDANSLGAGLAIMIGGTTALLLKSWLPLLMALGSVALFSYWHRMVYLGDHTVMER